MTSLLILQQPTSITFRSGSLGSALQAGGWVSFLRSCYWVCSRGLARSPKLKKGVRQLSARSSCPPGPAYSVLLSLSCRRYRMPAKRLIFSGPSCLSQTTGLD